MNTIQKRFVAFLIGCIGARTALALAVKKSDKKYLPIFGYLSFFIAFGFLFIFATGLRKTGVEVHGSRIWWNDIRPVHAFFYLWAACLALKKSNDAYIPLLFDVYFGLGAFFIHHIRANSFKKLLKISDF